jgi:hypothetical protein
MWPTVGTDAWARARARIVSASEASAALGLDRFRSPERLIADKLARLDAAEGVDAATLLAIAALNPGYDPNGASSAEPLRSSGSHASLGWRAKASGKKGGKKQKKRFRKSRGVGGRVPPTGNDDAPRARFAPPAVTHGNEFEPVARAHYAKMEGVEVHEFGLKIHDRLKWLGATPDGVVLVEDDDRRGREKKTRRVGNQVSVHASDFTQDAREGALPADPGLAAGVRRGGVPLRAVQAARHRKGTRGGDERGPAFVFKGDDKARRRVVGEKPAPLRAVREKSSAPR